MPLSLEVSREFIDSSPSPYNFSGVTGAKAATLSFLVGGTEEAFQLSHPVLSHMGKRIIHCGPSGSGLGAKICNNVRPSLVNLHLASPS